MHIIYWFTMNANFDYFVMCIYSIYSLDIDLNENIEKQNYIFIASSDKILNMLTLSEEKN